MPVNNYITLDDPSSSGATTLALGINGAGQIVGSIIAAGTYRFLTKDYPTIGLYNFAVAHKDLSEDLVYRLVKAVFDNHADLVKAHPLAKETVPENIDRNTLLPLHPGALRYYRERGIAIPAPALGATN